MKNKIILFLCAWSIAQLYQPLEANGGGDRRRRDGQQQQRRAGGHHGGGKGHHHGHGRGRGGSRQGGTGPAYRTRYAHRGTERGSNWHHGRGANHRAHFDEEHNRIWFFYNNAWLWTPEIKDTEGKLGAWLEGEDKNWLPLGTKENLSVGRPVKKAKPADVKPETRVEKAEAEKQVEDEEIEEQKEEETPMAVAEEAEEETFYY
jgi:hypothetical protein